MSSQVLRVCKEILRLCCTDDIPERNEALRNLEMTPGAKFRLSHGDLIVYGVTADECRAKLVEIAAKSGKMDVVTQTYEAASELV